MKQLTIFIVLVLMGKTALSQEKLQTTLLDPEQYHQRISGDKVQLIDVRTPQEYEEGHIKGAQNIDFFSDSFLREFSKLDKNKPVFIYCRSGNRSGKASAILSKEGFITVVDLKGGYKAWTAWKR